MFFLFTINSRKTGNVNDKPGRGRKDLVLLFKKKPLFTLGEAKLIFLKGIIIHFIIFFTSNLEYNFFYTGKRWETLKLYI